MIDHKPICVLCKLKGSHEKHGTILIDQAYTEAKALCLDIENNVDQKKKYLKQNLAKLVALDGSNKLPTNLLLTGHTPLDIAKIILDGLDMQPLQQIEPILSCECTEDRLVRSLRLLPLADVEDILMKQERVEARCEFCGKVYRLEANEVRDKLAQDPVVDL